MRRAMPLAATVSAFLFSSSQTSLFVYSVAKPARAQGIKPVQRLPLASPMVVYRGR